MDSVVTVLSVYVTVNKGEKYMFLKGKEKVRKSLHFKYFEAAKLVRILSLINVSLSKLN